MKRRSFLQLIGLTATTPVLAKLPQNLTAEDKILKPEYIKRESLRVPPKYGSGLIREVYAYDITTDTMVLRYDIATNSDKCHFSYPGIPFSKFRDEKEIKKIRTEAKKKMIAYCYENNISRSDLIKLALPEGYDARYI